MNLMAAMHPHFLRLPGGNYLEGDTLADWYNWYKTIGPLVDRPGHMAPWTYWSTDGLGLLEYLADNTATEPVLCVGTLRDEEGDERRNVETLKKLCRKSSTTTTRSN